jgi:hypothetical protein
MISWNVYDCLMVTVGSLMVLQLYFPSKVEG